MNRGKLYGVGVGPGDPELLTLKARRILLEADVVAVPDKGSGEKTALNIVKDVVEGKNLLPCPTPMVRDKALLDGCYEEIAGRICTLLDEGKNVAFITLGDPTLYSTYIYVHKKVLARGYDAELIPGVPSICAVAAKLGTSLCESAERLLVVPASYEGVDDCLDFPANKAFMKAGKSLPALRDKLRERSLDGEMVANCGMTGERVYHSLEELEEGEGYFSVVLVREHRNET
ncbi:precorrin-2 C(20)-methyltransferase [Pseudoflavonifractor sp.]|jgi:precorrin-2/cobalt-factor-2 C20-methyltransferase|uniref:precorrin-2 C(20)-methyltransferase n=1 Tax=Pseudoflavonifractor sp. TaxID=1980281 RepID=UPI003D8D717B